MVNTNTVLYQKIEYAAIITINRPKMKNVISSQMVAQLAEICNRIYSDHEVRGIIVTGAGDEAFCYGTDGEEFRSSEKGLKLIERFAISSIVNRFDHPTLAAINGDAFGQGLELALACDLRICSNHIRFGITQIKEGIIPWDGGTQRLARLVGRGKALEMILTGETIDAKEAYRIGLVNQVVPPEKLMATALDIAKEIAAKAPIATRYAKEAVNKGMDMTLDQGLRLEVDLYLLLHTTRDRTEGIQAFQEKRSPKFEGK